MRSKIIYTPVLLLCAALLFTHTEVSAQQHPERRVIRSGNKAYDKEDYTGAEEKYRRALEKMPLSYEGAFNLSDALYRQEKYDEALGLLKNLSENPAITPEQRAKVFYNLGNTMFRQQKLQEAADYYKESLRNNPADADAKYNLAYVNRLMQQQQDDKNNQDNQDNQNGDGNNGDNNQDNNNEQDNSDSDSQKDNGNDPNKDKSDGKQDKQDGKNGNQPERPDSRNGNGGQGKISRENAESMLNAIQQQEDNTREKVNSQKAVSVGRSGKNW